MDGRSDETPHERSPFGVAAAAARPLVEAGAREVQLVDGGTLTRGDVDVRPGPGHPYRVAPESTLTQHQLDRDLTDHPCVRQLDAVLAEIRQSRFAKVGQAGHEQHQLVAVSEDDRLVDALVKGSL